MPALTSDPPRSHHTRAHSTSTAFNGQPQSKTRAARSKSLAGPPPAKSAGLGSLSGGLPTGPSPQLHPYGSISSLPDVEALGLPPASVSELRQRTQQLIQNSITSTRINATPFDQPTFQFPSLATLPGEVPLHMQADDYALLQAMEQFGVGNSYANNTQAVSTLNLGHNRQSSSISNVFDPPRFAHSRTGSRASRARSRASSRASDTFVTEGREAYGPSKTLWLGNLDVQVTKGMIYEEFERYGPIENIRVLPEKTCAFVNFVNSTSAVTAHEDILKRQGGVVLSLNKTAPVLLGFGKDNAHRRTASTLSAAFSTSAETTTGNDGCPHGMAPTRAIRIERVPQNVSSTTLSQIFSPFGSVENTRILPGKRHGFVNFELLDSAVAAYESLNGKPLFGPDFGPVRIDFARVPTRAPSQLKVTFLAGDSLAEALGTVKGADSVPMERQMCDEDGDVENYRSPFLLDILKEGVHEKILKKGLTLDGHVSEKQLIMQMLSEESEDEDVRAVDTDRPVRLAYKTDIPQLQSLPLEIFTSVDLKQIESELKDDTTVTEEIDEFALNCLSSLTQLALHGVGNGIVQSLFKSASPFIRLTIIRNLAPQLASIGCHMRGTWVTQALIDNSKTRDERRAIVDAFRDWIPALMSDKIGNYICSALVAYGPEHNSVVFDAAVDRMLEVAQDRSGARCLIRCLDSTHTTWYQKKKVATAIILNSIPLVTSSNGALLVTWLLESIDIPRRCDLLAKRFLPHLTHLCIHGIASAAILRIIAQTCDNAASSLLISGIFCTRNDNVLKELLSDPQNGLPFIAKIVAIDTIPHDQRLLLEKAIKRTLPIVHNRSSTEYQMLNKTLKTGHQHHITSKKRPSKPALRTSRSNILQPKQVHERRKSSLFKLPPLFTTPQITSEQAHWYDTPIVALPSPEFRPVKIVAPDERKKGYKYASDGRSAYLADGDAPDDDDASSTSSYKTFHTGMPDHSMEVPAMDMLYLDDSINSHQELTPAMTTSSLSPTPTVISTPALSIQFPGHYPELSGIFASESGPSDQSTVGLQLNVAPEDVKVEVKVESKAEKGEASTKKARRLSQSVAHLPETIVEEGSVP
ncbi:hypothetical protein I350_07729 [Cryptococcus amylolentus CBS 6273]|uniref:RRM domain-containing protein n=1 Tax=Cryptococcus amylolentus CBS 6273 TaxID=1296118 RepID=A0A1E3JB63_9TREE|nr:hypothetical protein I350_07729 [Cryptococcus amylolentus CBS 6273]